MGLYYFTPFSSHIDNGFGAMADAFIEAAEQLSGSDRKFFNQHLVINFLYRHACELYLKSAILIVHRRFKLPFGENENYEEPSIYFNGKWIKIYHTHSIKKLYSYFIDLLNKVKDKLPSRTDWSSIPDDLKDCIDQIEQADENSTYFRYPVSGKEELNKNKSSFKVSSLDEFFKKIHNQKEKKKFFLLFNDENSLRNTYKYDRIPLKEIGKSLVKAGNILSSIHFALRAELLGGY